MPFCVVQCQAFKHTVRSYLLGIAHFVAMRTADMSAASAKTLAELDQSA